MTVTGSLDRTAAGPKWTGPEGPAIPFHRPDIADGDIASVLASLRSGRIVGDGPFTRRCGALLEDELGAPKVLLTTSATHALEMCALLLDIRPGDEVIVPDFTFVSTINAFALRRATPVFVDVRPDTLNLDETRLAQAITPRTRAIVPVHYAGVGCEMDAIMALASENGVTVVEDNAHGPFGSYRGRYLGTFGALAALSFHETKNITCGEGGALIINDPALVARAEIIREKGTDRSQALSHHRDKYGWVDLGSSYLPSDILAGLLHSQLGRWRSIQHQRGIIWERYRAGLGDWAQNRDVQLPTVPPHCEQAYHMFWMLFPTAERCARMRGYLASFGMRAVGHYAPLHLSPMGIRYGGKPGDCPVTESIVDRLLRLPFYNTLGEDDQARVVEAVVGGE